MKLAFRIGGVILLCFLWLYAIIELAKGVISKGDLSFPSNLEDVSELASALQHQTELQPYHVLSLFILAYLWKQAFAIPGSVLLNVLAGALFHYYGLILVCILSAVGSSICYLLSNTIGSEIIEKFAPDKLREFRGLVKQNEDNLLLFFISIRIIPMTPNWLINLASPLVGVPIRFIFLSALIGLLPYNFVCVQAGQILNQLESTSDILDIKTLLQLGLIGVAVLGLWFVKNKHKKAKQT